MPRVVNKGISIHYRIEGNPSPLPAMDVLIVGEMLKKLQTLWGGLLPYYLRISKAGESDVLTLSEAVSKVEASPSEDEFIVVAYADAVHLGGKAEERQER